MTRIFLFLLLSVFFHSAHAQTRLYTKPDLEMIKKNTKNKQSPYYFSKLMEKFQKGDSTMTLEEKRHLYYGYAYQNKPSELEDNDYQDSLKTVLHKDSFEVADYDKIIYYSGKVLKTNPFNMRIRRYQNFALRKTSQLAELQKNITRNNILFDAIISTGNGETKENAMFVINVGNEYDVIDMLGLKFGNSQSLVEMRYDYLVLEHNKYNLTGLYFDTSISLTELENLLKDISPSEKKK